MKKCMVITVGVASASMVLAGCSSGDSDSKSEYTVSGTVEKQWIDYECKSLSMAPVSFQKTRKPSTDKKKDEKESNKKSPTGKSTGSPSSVKPLKVPRSMVPTGKPVKPRGYSKKNCTTEYELFIKNSDGYFEQDVPYAHYLKCDEGKKFSSCTD